ncbi:hypothetical protein B0T17DRAFT_620176 [Bombardia bombarda]|uniref:Uncharacterized protein n=1 Tax=Bombardia bombarda TaxID=252184 RepID=A0AA39U7J1_9PEZI|nr:hypothetical protein B0T17DRAFT_620176 [Bombardia bombarda]
MFAPKRIQPPQVPTDEVFPGYFYDNVGVIRVVVRWMARIDDKHGNVEHHVPKEFTPERPAVRFVNTVFDMDIDGHPLASKLPKPTNRPSLQEGGGSFRELAGGPSCPMVFNDYIYSDEPHILLHVVDFRLAILITNWCSVLAGRENEVTPAVAPMPDVLDKVDALAHKKLEGSSCFMFAARHVCDLLFGPKMVMRMVFLPAASVKAMKQRALADVPGPVPPNTKPTISEGDIITAWCTRIVGLSLPPACTCTLVTLNVFELRSQLRHIFDHSADWDSFRIPLSDWTAAKFFERVNFSPAVTCAADSILSPILGQVFNVVGKDPDDNHWIAGLLSGHAWDIVEEEMKGMW